MQTPQATRYTLRIGYISIYALPVARLTPFIQYTQRLLGLVGWDLFEALLPWAKAGGGASADSEDLIFEVRYMNTSSKLVYLCVGSTTPPHLS